MNVRIRCNTKANHFLFNLHCPLDLKPRFLVNMEEKSVRSLCSVLLNRMNHFAFIVIKTWW